MKNNMFGRINVVYGDKGGRFPFCNSLFIDDSVKVVVDPGAGHNVLSAIREKHHIESVINTHYHFDHIAYNHLFNDAEVYLNEIEAGCFRDRKEIVRRLGMVEVYGERWADSWLDRISNPETAQSPYSPQNRNEWWLSTARLGGTYKWGDVFDFGTTKMEVVGTPGHTAGFCCLYFPGEGAVYTGDIDLTGFGPWYAGLDGDIDLFIKSAHTIQALDADIYITSHEEGVLKRTEFLLKLEEYLEKVDRSESRILSFLSQPVSLEEITGLGLFYGKKFLVDDWVRAWEELTVRKHLERLLQSKVITCIDNRFVRV